MIVYVVDIRLGKKVRAKESPGPGPGAFLEVYYWLLGISG
jgi:hypothetical protein